MPRENVEMVRETFARLRRREPVLDVLSPDILWEVRSGPEQGDYRGVEAVAEYYRRYFGTWEDFRIEIEEIHDLSDGRVFVVARDSGRGKGSGVEVEMLGLPDLDPQRRQGRPVAGLP